MYKTYPTAGTHSFYVNEPKNTYQHRKPSERRYLSGNSYNTYCMVKQAIPVKEGHWLMLFDEAGSLIHTGKMGNAETGFSEIGVILKTALRNGCLNMLLVSFSEDYYQANRKDVVYNINLIAAANGISMVLLDHLVIEPDGYYSFRDNGLLAYLNN